MSYKINNDGKEYVSYYARTGRDRVYNVFPGYTLESKYMDYIKEHRKYSMMPLTILIGWLMFPMSIGVIYYAFNMLTGNYTELGFEDANTYAKIMSVVIFAIFLSIFLLLVKAFRWTLRNNKPPEADDILWRKGKLVYKATTRRKDHTERILRIDDEPMKGATIYDYNAGRKDDEYIVIYRLRNDKVVESFAIYSDLELTNYRRETKNL